MWLANGVPEASRIKYELCGWLMTFPRKLAICTGEWNWVWGMWLANGIPEEIWMPVLAGRFGNELYGWSMAFLRKLATCAREWV